MATGYPSEAEVQAKLDTTAQGRGIRIVRSAKVSSTVKSFYVVPVVTYAGQSKWVNIAVASVACTASAASVQAALIVASMRA